LESAGLGGYGVAVVDGMTSAVGTVSASVFLAKAMLQHKDVDTSKDKAGNAGVAKTECNGVKQRCYIVVGQWSLLCHGH